MAKYIAVVKHSRSKTAWNVNNEKPGCKYRLAIVPYVVSDWEEINTRNRLEAHEIALSISNFLNTEK